ELSIDIIIPKGLEFSDGDKTTSYLLESVVIKAGDTKVTGVLKLNKKIKIDEVKTEIVTSPYPYVLHPKSLESFSGGSEDESDEEFFPRAILSLGKFSTAGSQGAYEYFTYKADERVRDVDIQSTSEGMIDIYIDVESNNEAKTNVEAIFANEKVQALNDHVSVYHAVLKEVTIIGTIHIFDLLDEVNIRESISSNFSKRFRIGENLPYSALIKDLHVAGVFKVELNSNSDLIVNNNEILNLTFDLNFVKASYE
ncbi:baseplate J/gp47 family protein, partial [Poseidonibacter sp.]|uniref:baseplate J/gp47 family protein n=1 Tax=Poseidonibacter sp. TaxID=2321188 RepID=UPI003C74190B